jgi:peroxiredoxin
MNEPSIGARAPAFELPNQKGLVRSLAEYLEGGPVLLAFHRGTW